MATQHEYQVITVIPEDDEWEEQELVTAARDLETATAMRDAPVAGHLPPTAWRYIEVRSFTDWERL
jgi:hypothetical protein